MSDNNPSAFPNKFDYGMSLRDYFAAMAMQGMNASPALFEVVTSSAIHAGTAFQRMAQQAYKQADAMLAEREK